MTTLSSDPVAAASNAGASGNARVVLRAYRGPQDHPEMNRVANLVRAANGDPMSMSSDDMDNYYARFDQELLALDCVLAELDGRVVGYARATWEAMAVGGSQVNAIMNVDPGAGDEGIAELLAGHVVARGGTLIRDLAGEAASISVQVLETQAGVLPVLERLGFRRVRSNARLVRPDLEDIAEVPLPDGFEIRPISATDRGMHRRVWDASARAFSGSWGEEVPTERAYEAWLDGSKFDPPLWRVAFHGDEIAGQILNFMDDVEPDGSRLGWTESISVQPEYRRRGLARALLVASLRAVRDAGATKAALGVDLQNPNDARALYESLGFRIVSVGHELLLGPYPPGSGPDLREVPA
jgi:mycothiol synthase